MISQFTFDGRFIVEQRYLLGRGRRSATVGVDTGVFFETLEAAAGAALPERICRLGEASTFDETGPTDCDRSPL